MAVQWYKRGKKIVSVLTYWDLRVCAQISPCGRGQRGWCMPTTRQPPTSGTELGAGWLCTQTLKEILGSVA